jgi:hypothetical protein
LSKRARKKHEAKRAKKARKAQHRAADRAPPATLSHSTDGDSGGSATSDPTCGFTPYAVRPVAGDGGGAYFALYAELLASGADPAAQSCGSFGDAVELATGYVLPVGPKTPSQMAPRGPVRDGLLVREEEAAATRAQSSVGNVTEGAPRLPAPQPHPAIGDWRVLREHTAAIVAEWPLDYECPLCVCGGSHSADIAVGTLGSVASGATGVGASTHPGAGKGIGASANASSANAGGGQALPVATPEEFEGMLPPYRVDVAGVPGAFVIRNALPAAVTRRLAHAVRAKTASANAVAAAAGTEVAARTARRDTLATKLRRALPSEPHGVAGYHAAVRAGDVCVACVTSSSLSHHLSLPMPNRRPSHLASPKFDFV